MERSTRLVKCEMCRGKGGFNNDCLHWIGLVGTETEETNLACQRAQSGLERGRRGPLAIRDQSGREREREKGAQSGHYTIRFQRAQKKKKGKQGLTCGNSSRP